MEYFPNFLIQVKERTFEVRDTRAKEMSILWKILRNMKIFYWFNYNFSPLGFNLSLFKKKNCYFL